MAVYIGSDVPLRTWPFDRATPGFHVTSVPGERSAVRKHFSKAFVYYAGTHEGCGCPFQTVKSYPEHEIDPTELRQAEECRAAIATYVAEALQLQPEVEIYACWSGDEAKPVASTHVMASPTFPEGFVERQFIVVEQPRRAVG